MNREFLNQIICADCEGIIPRLDDESIDLVITSPPYNVDLGNNKYRKTRYDMHKDDLPHDVYIDWMISILRGALYHKMRKGGRICINIGDGKNGAVPTHAELISQMCHRYLPMSTIIWDK